MVKSATIQARIDSKTKEKAQSVLDELGLSMSEAVVLFLKQVVFHKGIPFELKVPTKLTAETLKKAEAGKDVRVFSDVDELFEELDS
jgi:DNA-damage-inducible protein J